mgnify:CR=1 FL=1
MGGGGVHGTVSSFGILHTVSVYFFSISLAATVDLRVSRIGSIAQFLLLVEDFGPIRDTITPTLAVTGIEKMKKKVRM